MKLLLDTHTAIWMMNKHARLPSGVKAMLLDEENTLYISIVSAWEVAIKVSLGKLPELPGGVKKFLSEAEELPITLLPIAPRHIEIVETLPLLHRDPFDRLLVAAAMAEGMTLLTADENIHRYDVPSVW